MRGKHGRSVIGGVGSPAEDEGFFARFARVRESCAPWSSWVVFKVAIWAVRHPLLGGISMFGRRIT